MSCAAARVDRIAPAAARGEGQSTVTVYCRLDGTPLRPGMGGHARFYGDQRSVGGFLTTGRSATCGPSSGGDRGVTVGSAGGVVSLRETRPTTMGRG